MTIQFTSSFVLSLVAGVVVFSMGSIKTLKGQSLSPTENAIRMTLTDSEAHLGGSIEVPGVNYPIANSECGGNCASSCPSCRSQRRAAKHLEKYGEPKITLGELWRREMPSGTQSLHFPYQAEKLYYYRHPYNSSAIQQARSNQGMLFQQYGNPYPHPGQPYHSNVFEGVYQSHANNHYGTVESRTLEFVDWQKHQNAKATWEATEQSKPQENEQFISPPAPLPEAPIDEGARLSESKLQNRNR